jgi:hypothetical protein
MTGPPVTADAGMSRIAAAFQARAGASAELGNGDGDGDPIARLILAIERGTRQQALHDRLLRSKAIAAWPQELPVMPYNVSAGVLSPGTGLAGSAHIGPRTGYFWDITRLTVDGLVPGGGTAQEASGAQTAPALNTTICQIANTSLIPGTYTVQWNVGLTAGTPAAGTDNSNMQLRYGSTTLLQAEYPAVIGQYPQDPVQLTVTSPASSLLIRNNPNAGTTGVTYTAQFSLTPVPSDQVTAYKTVTGIAAGQKRLHTFIAEGPGTVGGSEWFPGKGACVLRDGDGILLSATSSLAATAITLSGEYVQIEAGWIGDYFL